MTDLDRGAGRDLAEVYRSLSRPPCDERVLVLQAVGIGSQLVFDGAYWHVFVAATDQAVARQQLERYERENPPRPPPAARIEPQPHAWIGSVAYALVVLLVGYLAGIGAFDQDWLEAGALRASQVRAGDLWRAVTALTLHLDVAHLVANLGFGMLFGYFAGQLLGPGLAWASIAGAATTANLLNALVQPAQHSSAGASTAVFATLGLLAAYGWRQRHSLRERWAYRYAPLIAGVALLAFLGVGGERTDVLAHLSGFAVGGAVGWWHGRPGHRRAPGAGSQLALGLAVVAIITVAWWLALLPASEPG